MNRRHFLYAAAASSWPLAAQIPPHRLPATDHHYHKVRGYVEDVPVPEYRWASERAYDAFRDLKYGVRIHWGLYSMSATPGESWPFLTMSYAQRQQYQQRYRTWNPSAFDADEWMNLFAESGMKMFAFTTKHHDGFSMFDTKARVARRVNYLAPGGPAIENCDLAYSITETPFRRDVVRELCAAARKRNIKIDLYFSHPDWYDADFRPYNYHPLQTRSSAELEETRERMGDRVVLAPDPSPAELAHMMTRHRRQLEELLTSYGPIDMLCLDQWLGAPVWPQLRDTILHLRRIQPDVMLRARGIGNYGDYYTPEGFVPGSKENTGVPWFVIHALGSSFSYDPDPRSYKGAGWIVSNLVDAVAKGGNLMVGIGPDGLGRFHPAAAAQLREVGEWLRVNGEGIYATRPRAGTSWQEPPDVRFTQTKDQRYTYAFLLRWPGPQIRLRTLRARPGTSVRLLGHPASLAWRNNPSEGLTIELPLDLQEDGKRRGKYCWAFRIEAEPS
ncbi:MAG: alpha-L-fucosidase [Bryobacteraceae bacterium]